MRCSKCGSENPADNNFCAHCGNALSRPCTKCGAENSSTSSFCGKCGAGFTNNTKSVGHISSARQSAPDIEVVAEHAGTALAFEGERKAVTALFADIKGSTELMRDLDPEEARAIVDPALKLMIDAARRYDCY
jgi:ribosomal protein L40E